MEKYLKERKMLDYSSKNIQRLIQERNWNDTLLSKVVLILQSLSQLEFLFQ